jgi:hypothetical protein
MREGLVEGLVVSTCSTPIRMLLLGSAERNSSCDTYVCAFLLVQIKFCGQEVSNVLTAVTLGLSSGGIVSSQEAQELLRLATPPLREDDKDGHYVFAVGDNLTPRCNYLIRI